MVKRTPKNHYAHSLFQKKSTRQLLGVLFIAIFAGIGIRLLSNSHAASPYASVSADKGMLGTGATSLTDNTASDGHHVEFGSSSSCGGGSVLPTPTSLDSTYKTLAFDDEFCGTTLNTSKWETCVWYASPPCYAPDNNSIGDNADGKTLATAGGSADAANVSVNNELTLLASSSTSTASNSWHDGYIDTGPHYETPQGNYYVEIKAKMPPPAPGLWPALVLYEDGDLPPSGKAYAEIDMLEAITEADGGCPTNTMTGWQSWVPPGSGAELHNEIGGPSTGRCNINYTGWNTYGIAVSSTGNIVDYFNANQNGSVMTVGSAATEGMFISLSLTTGGGTQNNGWAGIPTTSTPSPSTMNVAYVRVFTP